MSYAKISVFPTSNRARSLYAALWSPRISLLAELDAMLPIKEAIIEKGTLPKPHFI
jgi:hypothetical protein